MRMAVGPVRAQAAAEKGLTRAYWGGWAKRGHFPQSFRIIAGGRAQKSYLKLGSPMTGPNSNSIKGLIYMPYEARRECNCVTRQGASRAVEERYVGADRTNGRFADVTVTRCAACRRLWLRYQVEYEHTSRSGRWAEGIVDEATATRITPENAAKVLSSLPWHIYGGSWFGHAGKKREGPIPDEMWDVASEGPG